MASSLARRLDRLERLAAELLNPDQGPVYVHEGGPNVTQNFSHRGALEPTSSSGKQKDASQNISCPSDCRRIDAAIGDLRQRRCSPWRLPWRL
jgi:hypothetical protein